MTIVQELKVLISNRGGNPEGITRISEALAELARIDAEEAVETVESEPSDPPVQEQPAG